MRILYFSHNYSTHDRRFLTKMAQSLHEILFVRLCDDGLVSEPPALPEGVRAIRWKGVQGALTPDECLRAMPRFARVLDQANADLIHAGPIPTCAFMVALAGARPLLSMSWGSDILLEAKENDLAGWAAKYALARSDAFVVDCDAVRKEIATLSGAESERFVQFPWGLDLGRFPAATRAPQSGGEITVVSTRSWAPVYGIDTVLEAFRLAHMEEPRLRLILVGGGPLAALVEEKVSEGDLRALVRRPGRIAEEALATQLASADVYLSCAHSDGTSVSLLEAMAHGLPAVVTDAGGNREWVTPDRGGWLAPVGDAKAFASALVRAARLDEAERREIAQWNRRVVETRADWHKNARLLLAAYERYGHAR